MNSDKTLEKSNYQLGMTIKIEHEASKKLIENWKSLEGSFLDEIRSIKVMNPQASIGARYFSKEAISTLHDIFPLLVTNLLGILNIFQSINVLSVLPYLVSESQEELHILEYTKPNYTVQLARFKETSKKEIECALAFLLIGNLDKIFDDTEKIISIIELFNRVILQYIDKHSLPIDNILLAGFLKTKEEDIKITKSLGSYIEPWLKDKLISEAREINAKSIAVNVKISQKEYNIQIQPQAIVINVRYSEAPFEFEPKKLRNNLISLIKDDFVSILRKIRGEF